MANHIYKRVDANEYQRIFVVGDIHGKLGLLLDKLEEVNFSDKDLLISVGDLIDRGPMSLDTLRFFRANETPNIQMVIGNHEMLAIAAIRNHRLFNDWYRNGGSWYDNLSTLEEDEVNLILLDIYENCPYIIEIDDNGYKTVVAHADYPSNQYEFGKQLNNLELEDVIWSRTRLQFNDKTTIKGADKFIFGHTPLEEPVTVANRMYIDTGAYKTDNLTLIQVK